jgi:hypothetical protein
MWFTEDALTPCAVFGAIGLAVVLWARRNEIRSLQIVGSLLLLLAGSTFLVDRLVVTERERIEQRVVSLCDDFRNKREATVDYFSAQSPDLKNKVKSGMALVTIEGRLRLTDFEIRITNNHTSATSQFRANATISVAGYGNVGHQPSRFLLTWTREQGDWKILRVQRMHPYQDKELGLLEQTPG